MNAALEITNLVKRYGDVTAVDDVSLTANEGEIFGILGPNGAGKTTTVECVQGLRRPTSGAIRVFGQDAINDHAAVRNLVGSQLQESGLPHRIKVWEAVDLFARDAQARSGWRDLLARWDLADKEKASFASLSGGQRQRLFLALALVNRPRIVFFDELTQGLDPTARRMTWEHIRDIRAGGTTVILITHFMEEAEALCDRLTIVDKGRVIATGTPVELTRDGQTIVTLPDDVPVEPASLRSIEGVTGIEKADGGARVIGDGRIAQSVPAALWSRGHRTADLRVTHPTLEDVYLHLITGQEATDANAA